MDLEISTLNTIISAAAGLIAGTIASLIAPWVNWGIEKKRMRRQKRQKLLTQLRVYLESSGSRTDILDQKEYLQLKRHMRQDTISKLEDGEPPHRISREKKSILLDELHCLEEKWGIV
jgi:hypothetical protein